MSKAEDQRKPDNQGQPGEKAEKRPEDAAHRETAWKAGDKPHEKVVGTGHFDAEKKPSDKPDHLLESDDHKLGKDKKERADVPKSDEKKLSEKDVRGEEKKRVDQEKAAAVHKAK